MEADLHKLKKLWETARVHSIKAPERSKVMAEMMELARGKFSEVCFLREFSCY